MLPFPHSYQSDSLEILDNFQLHGLTSVQRVLAMSVQCSIILTRKAFAGRLEMQMSTEKDMVDAEAQKSCLYYVDT